MRIVGYHMERPLTSALAYGTNLGLNHWSSSFHMLLNMTDSKTHRAHSFQSLVDSDSSAGYLSSPLESAYELHPLSITTHSLPQ